MSLFASGDPTGDVEPIPIADVRDGKLLNERRDGYRFAPIHVPSTHRPPKDEIVFVGTISKAQNPSNRTTSFALLAVVSVVPTATICRPRVEET